MLEITISCCQCGRELSDHIQASELSEFTLDAIAKFVKKKKWIVQINGENFDTYCCKTCAK